MLFEETADGLFALSAIVDIGGIHKVDAAFQRGFENPLGFRCIERITPAGAQLPGAQTDFTDAAAGIAKNAMVHGFILLIFFVSDINRDCQILPQPSRPLPPGTDR